ncbi:MAG: NAD-dependent epimerase/dehydratase family protein, partial [Solirubrobacteraceae bacterium]
VRREVPAASIAIGPGLLDADVFGRFDGTRARNELGYAPAEDLVAGIHEYAGWLSEHNVF